MSKKHSGCNAHIKYNSEWYVNTAVTTYRRKEGNSVRNRYYQKGKGMR